MADSGDGDGVTSWEEITHFLLERGVAQEVIDKLEFEKVDAQCLRCMKDSDLQNFLTKIGDRYAIRNFLDRKCSGSSGTTAKKCGTSQKNHSLLALLKEKMAEKETKKQRESVEELDINAEPLQKTNDLSKEQKFDCGDEIGRVIRAARKRRFNIAEEKRITQEIELQSYLNRLLLDDRDRLSESVKEKFKGDEDRIQAETIAIEEQCNAYKSELNKMFAKLDDRRRKREVPDYLRGKISFEVLCEPVVTPSGITYDRKDIEKHLQLVGSFDPITRRVLTKEKLAPNLAMQEVVDTFLAENEWALDY